MVLGRIIRKLIFSFVVFFCSALMGADKFMQVSQIEPGMKGIGYTAFEHNKIESFGVEIIEVVYNYFPSRDIILVRLVGDRVERTGVVAGMSGSPIYIEGKLIGALAYRIGSFQKEPIAGITPIHEMLKIFDKEDKREQEAPFLNPNQNFLSDQYLNALNGQNFDLLSVFKSELSSSSKNLQPIKTPLLVSGLHPAVYSRISGKFDHANFEIMSSGTVLTKTGQDDSLKPGEGVGGVIVNGSFDISAVGTVTYVDGNKVLAFGHPLFNSGPVNVPMARANVITTLASLYASNKFAVSTDIIGNIRQDRSSGIMGILGETPPMIPVNVLFRSPLSGDLKFNFNLVKDKSNYNILPVFLWLTLVNAIESARLGNSDYAIKLNGSIELENQNDVKLNNFYAGNGMGFYDGSGQDIPEAAYEIAMTFGALLVNKFKIPNVKGVNLEFEVIPGQKSIKIEKVYFDKKKLKPGESLKLIVHLRPYHKEQIEVEKKITIPRNIDTKKLTLVIAGNETVTQWEMKSRAAKFIPDSFGDIVEILNRRRKNNYIYIQLKSADNGAVIHGKEYSEIPPSIYKVMNQEKSQKTFRTLSDKIIKEWEIPTDYAISGGRKFEIKIEQSAKL